LSEFWVLVSFVGGGYENNCIIYNKPKTEMSNSNSFSFDKKIFGIKTQKHDTAESTGNLSLMERIKTMFSNENYSPLSQDKKLIQRIKGNLQSPENHKKTMRSFEQQLPKDNFFNEATKKNTDTSHSPIDKMLRKPVSKSKRKSISKQKKTKKIIKIIKKNISRKTKNKKDHAKKPPWRPTGKNITYKKLKNKNQNII
jgi:hypothetical protein